MHVKRGGGEAMNTVPNVCGILHAQKGQTTDRQTDLDVSVYLL